MIAPPPSRSPYWFPVKRYGWGRDAPTTCQGWAATIAFIVALAVGGILLAPRSIPWFVAFAFVAAGVLIAIGFATKEQPRWRWGD